MAQLRVTITAISPLCFSERRPGRQFRYSTEYVPGSVLRGSIAAIMLREGKEHDVDFQRLFGVGQPPAALFRHAYPDEHILPHTALSCKDNPGFGPSEKKHGVFDTLIDRLCFEQLNPPGLLYRPRCPQSGCDPGRVEAFTGFYSLEKGQYHQKKVPQRLLTRVGINRRRMAAEDALLYAPMVISEAWWKEEKIECAHFTGTVWVEDALADPLTGILLRVTHLGSGTARGLGQVQVQCEQDKVESEQNTTGCDQAGRAEFVIRRLKSFNEVLQSRWKKVGGLCEEAPPHCPKVFTIDLRSDAILKEKDWLPATVLTAEMLCEATGEIDLSLRLIRSYASYDYRGGWNTGQRLPKDTALVTRLGSVFVFQTDDLDRWIRPLAALEISGLGERTAEGFGEVVICDPFHVSGRKPK